MAETLLSPGVLARENDLTVTAQTPAVVARTPPPAVVSNSSSSSSGGSSGRARGSGANPF